MPFRLKIGKIDGILTLGDIVGGGFCLDDAPLTDVEITGDPTEEEKFLYAAFIRRRRPGPPGGVCTPNAAMKEAIAEVRRRRREARDRGESSAPRRPKSHRQIQIEVAREGAKDRKVQVEEGACDLCERVDRVLCADNSDGEYNPVRVCRACIDEKLPPDARDDWDN